MNTSFMTCCLVFCMCLSAGAFIKLYRQPKISVIDLDLVVRGLSQSLAAQYPKGDVPKRVLADLLEEIRENMEVFAHKHRVHLIAKKACFSKAVDLTDAFMKEMGYETD